MAEADDKLPDIALADAEGQMHKGRAGSLLAMAALGVAVIAGLVMLVGGEDQARVYGELGKTINGLERGSFVRFWGCALEGENVNDLRSNGELIAKVDGRGMERGRNYGVHVREKCLPMLKGIGPELDTLIAPPDLQQNVKALKDANNALRGAWSDYVGYLDDPELVYDQEKAKPFVTAIARGWYDFRKAYGELNKTIKSKLE